MKGALKALMWVLFGGGVGFFIGERIGERIAEKNAAEAEDRGGFAEPEHRMTQEEYDRIANSGENEARRKRNEIKAGMILQTYAGNRNENVTIEMSNTVPDIPANTREWMNQDCQPPVPITEEEYYRNENRYDQEELLYYTEDEVLYNLRTRTTEVEAEILGKNALANGFGGDPNNPVETIYIESPIAGTLYKIDRIDAAFCDDTEPGSPSEEDDGDEAEDIDDF